jgi:2-polyprenyl-6-methoxyphenol hydroxylase-like FAD-dependent oxidoreductase
MGAVADSSGPDPSFDCDVLVVGAGPVGLTLAADLARRGRHVRIIDRLAAPTTESRAIIVHSRSLDQLEALGAVDEVMARALVARGMQMHSGDKVVASVSFEHITAVYPFSAALLQTDTEAAITARMNALGVEVERSLTLTGATDDGAGVTSTLTDADGGTRTIRSRYLVGTDGASSTVRHLMGEHLQGSFAGEDFLIGDVEGDHPYDTAVFHTFFGPGQSTGLLFPLRGGRVRVFAQLPEGTDKARPASAEWLQECLDERGIQLRVGTPHWLTRFELKHGQVAQYRSGRMFLAGDAAHIHSPAGGLGMNTGIQDATNLGWKLAHALTHQSGEALLDSYQGERHPVAAGVIAFTTRLSNVGTLSNPLAQRVRNLVMHLGFDTPAIADRIASTVEQQSVRYRDSTVVRGGGRSLHAGDFLYLPDTHVAAAIAATDGHVAIVLPRGDAFADLPAGVARLEVSEVDADALAEESDLRSGGAIVVRPDGYIGCLAATPEDVASYLSGLDA